MNAEIDLRELSLRRDERLAPPRRRLVSRYLLPLALVAGFAGVVAWAARDRLLPARRVTVVPVVATRSFQQRGGAAAFTAAGWVEPRPTPIHVTALAEGVIAELLVVEDQAVAAGEPVARLIEDDARLTLAEAAADLRLREAELASAAAALSAARTNLEFPTALEATLAEAEARLAERETERANLPFEIQMADSRLLLARQELEGKTRAGDGVAERTVQRAQSELDTAAAARAQLEERGPRLDRQIDALTRKRDALAQQLELLTEEKRAVADADARQQAAAAHVEQAKVAVETADLRLERMTVRAPAAGRVLSLVARPGSKLMGQDPNAMHEASTVVTLYDPSSLQVRADVRLEDVPHCAPGQGARIASDALAQPLEGEVLFATSSANIQKNTLEIKVAIPDAPAVLKPEMLVQVTFLAPEPTGESPPTERYRLFAPRALVESAGEASQVWVADLSAGVARQKTVRLGPASDDRLVEIVEGLQAADRLIATGRDGLEDGTRIEVVGEDAALGTEPSGAERPADEEQHDAHP